MPYIDCKITKSLTESQKEKLKSEFGKSVALIGKPESYLMVGICDNYTLYFGGQKLNEGAYVEVSLFGSAPSSAYEKMTESICAVLKKELQIQGSAVYVTYHPVQDWGWNGQNF